MKQINQSCFYYVLFYYCDAIYHVMLMIFNTAFDIES